MAQLLPSGVNAQTEQIDQLRSDRDAVRDDRVRAAQDLNPLFAANEELEEGLRLLTEDLGRREAELSATRSQLEQARVAVISAQDEVLAQQLYIEDLRAELQKQAITAYVQPRGIGGDDVLRANDLNEGERQRALVSAVQTSQADLLDSLRVAEADRELAVARAEAATLEIEARQGLAEQQIAEVDAAIARQQRLQSILDGRIAEFQAEVDLLSSEESALQAEITGLIIEEEARQAAIREAARIQAERERVAREEEQRRLAQLAALAAGTPPPQEQAVSRASAGLVNAPSAGAGTLSWPVIGTVTSRFGPRWGRQHNGIDVAANTGTTVASAGTGTVIAAGNSGGFGNRVLIDHGGGLVTLYAHLSSINVSIGQSVGPGSSLGAVGCTGNCTGPHLHFETRVGGVAYDPYVYLS